MPPPFFGLHEDDQPAVAKAPKSVTRSFTCGTERTSGRGSLATAREGELPAAQSLSAGTHSRSTSSCSAASSSCSAALSSAASLHWAAISNRHHRCSMTHMHTAAATTTTAAAAADHQYVTMAARTGTAHAGQDRMPLGARSPLHVFTLTAVEHHELTPWIRFGNRQSVHELATKAEGATTSSSRTRPIPTTEPGPGLGTPGTSRSGFDLRPPRSSPLPGARLRIIRAELTIGAKAVRSWQASHAP